MRKSDSLLFLPEVNAYKIQSPYTLLNGGRFNSRVWSESGADNFVFVWVTRAVRSGWKSHIPTGKDPGVVQLSQKAIQILKEITKAGNREDLKVLELEAENLRVNCELTELQKVNARHIQWLKEKNDQVKELEAKQKHAELEKLDLQQHISTLMEERSMLMEERSTLMEESSMLMEERSMLIEESAAKTNQISMLIEESAAKTNQMKELETGIQEKEKELLTKIDDNLTEWRTKNSTL